MTSRLILTLLLLMLLITMNVAVIAQRVTDGRDTRLRRQRLVIYHGDGDWENEPRRAHLAGSLCRNCRGKPATRDRPEDTETSGERQSTNTEITTMSSSTDNADRFTATPHHRSTRDIPGQSARPRRVLSRIPRRNSRLTQELSRRRQLGSTRRRLDLLIDRLLQLKHGQSDRNPPSVNPSSSKITSGGGGIPANSERRKSESASDKRFMENKALYKRRSINDLSEQLSRNPFNVRRRRPPIDPMLLMVGIGRK